MKMFAVIRRKAVLCCFGLLILFPAMGNPPEELDVFVLPVQQELFSRANQMALSLVRAGQLEQAESVYLAALEQAPKMSGLHYNLACVRFRSGKKDIGYASLEKAAEYGFRDIDHMQKDMDLLSIHREQRFLDLLNRVRAMPKIIHRQVEPLAVKDRRARVDQANTGWVSAPLPHFRVFHSLDTDPAKAQIMTGDQPAAVRLRKWHDEGTAAGLYGVLYDNHDRGHSRLNTGRFPQLAVIEYAEAAKERGFDNGLQTLFIHNMPVLGNSSTAITGGAFWRSQPRLAQVNERQINMQYLHYLSNHLYFYPEHRDHDPVGEDGKGQGDVYPANTPYVVVSQGSSGSDRQFMEAFAAAIAAFHPETRAKLEKHGILAPTLVAIFRRCNAGVESDTDYRSGSAHPMAFQGSSIRLEKMLEMAHAMKAEEVPPVVQLKLLEEDLGEPGVDYFDVAPREKLFDTPCAIARVFRARTAEKRFLVSAEASKDINSRPLSYHWRVLRGDAEGIRITPQNESAFVVEIIIPWHERSPVESGSELCSSRVDIGAFVNNGVYDSAPGFISVSTLAGENREYDDKGILQAINYRSQRNGGNYADPAIHTPHDWRDEYKYSPYGDLLGWTRVLDGKREDFTFRGELVLERDDLGRPRTVSEVIYRLEPPASKNKTPTLVYEPHGEVILYRYTGVDDLLGRRARKDFPQIPVD